MLLIREWMLALGDCGHGNSFTIFLYLRHCFLTQGQDLRLSRNFGLIFFSAHKYREENSSDPYFHYAELITINNVGIFVSSLFIQYSVFKTYTVELCEKKIWCMSLCVCTIWTHTHILAQTVVAFCLLFPRVSKLEGAVLQTALVIMESRSSDVTCMDTECIGQIIHF